jgi:hypothetical protein
MLMNFGEFMCQSKALWEGDNFTLSKLYNELEEKFRKAEPEVYEFIMGETEFPSFKVFKDILSSNIDKTRFSLEDGLLMLFCLKKNKKTDLIVPETRKSVMRQIAREQQIIEDKKGSQSNRNSDSTNIIYTPMGNKR